MINTGYSPYGSSQLGSSSGSAVGDFLQKYQLTSQSQQNTITPQPIPSPISELDEFLAGLSSDKRNAVEMSSEYQSLKLRLFEKFLTYQIAMTTDGSIFLSTSAGRKMAQDLLDSAQKISKNFESNSKNELQEMKNLIQKQSAEIEELKTKLNDSQKILYDFSKEAPSPKQSIVVSSKNKKEEK